MRAIHVVRIALVPLWLALAAAACKETDTTTAPGAIANLTINAPDTARSGQSFTVDVAATAVGVNNVHNGHVQVMVPPPLVVDSVAASPGTGATFSANSVAWDLGSLDSNSQSTLHVTATGTLPPGSMSQTLTVEATLTADGISPGNVVADDSLQLMP